MNLLRLPDVRRLLVGQTVSGLGDWMATFAFMALALSVSDSAVAVGGILTLRLLPAALGASVAARLSMRWDRKATMVSMDLLRAVIVCMVPLVGQLWWVYLWAFLLEAASLVFVAARDASVPDLVEPRDLPLANGLVLATSYGGIPIGAALFALVAALPLLDGGWFAGRDHALVFWLDGLTFLVSAALIARIGGLRPRPAAPSPPGDAPSPDGTVAPAPVRLRDAWGVPLVRSVMPAATAAALGLGALFSLGIVLVRDELGASDAEFGVLIALFGVGAALGLALTRALAERDLLGLTRMGTLAMGSLVAVMSLSGVVWLAFCGAVGFGAAATVTLTSGMSCLQGVVDTERRVVAFAAFHVVIRVGLGTAAVGAGALGEVVGTRPVLLGSGVVTMLSAGLVRGVASAGEARAP